MASHRSVGRPGAGLALDCWYPVAASSAVGRELTALRALGRPVVLFRTTTGQVAALLDRCAHRAFPLSAGVLDGDAVRCGLCGFVYDAGGQCIAVPTQSHVPYGAAVDAFPTREADGLVWAWFGDPGRSRVHRVPDLPWLTGVDWVTVGHDETVPAGFLLLHENFADVTQVPFVAPDIAPSVLGPALPELAVTVSERGVGLHREFPPAPLPAWQAELLGVGSAPHEHRQEGFFLSPAVWVDHWDVRAAGGVDAPWHRLRFTHLLTPIDGGTTRVLWRVSGDLPSRAAGSAPAVAARLREVFEGYYARVFAAMAAAQRVLDLDGPGPQVNVSADVAALKVREIVGAMLAEQAQAGRGRRR